MSPPGRESRPAVNRAAGDVPGGRVDTTLPPAAARTAPAAARVIRPVVIVDLRRLDASRPVPHGWSARVVLGDSAYADLAQCRQIGELTCDACAVVVEGTHPAAVEQVIAYLDRPYMSNPGWAA